MIAMTEAMTGLDRVLRRAVSEQMHDEVDTSRDPEGLAAIYEEFLAAKELVSDQGLFLLLVALLRDSSPARYSQQRMGQWDIVEVVLEQHRRHQEEGNYSGPSRAKTVIMELVSVAPAGSPEHALQWAIINFAFKHGCLVDMAFYSPAQWQAAKETMGMQAVFTLTCEGPLLHTIYTSRDEAPKAEFEEIVEKHGFWYELGHHWSRHFYCE